MSGPITLFDKSFIQSLSLDESVWFDHYYYSIVCPIFYVETLADLAKKLSAGRSSEKEVAKIADKFPEMSGNPCMYHSELCLGNLLGSSVAMDGRIMMRGGTPVKGGGRTGFVFKAPPETKAFQRWQHGEFEQLEAEFARTWRQAVSDLDLNQTTTLLEKFGINRDRCKTLEGCYDEAHKIVSGQQPFEQMALAVLFLQVPSEHHQEIMQRWHLMNMCPISKFAPYAAYVLKVEIFFQLSVSAGHIAATRPSNRVDIAYLFYLPFCMMFVSSDKLHRRCAPLFMRDNQSFVWGRELKTDLRRLNERFTSLDQETKDRGIMSFASRPPQDEDYLTASLWDRHMSSKWRQKGDVSVKDNPELEKKLVQELNQFNEGEPLSDEEVDFDAESADSMSIQRLVRKKKGNWFQVPKDLKDG